MSISQQTQHLASSVVMVTPIDFCFNEQTGVDNAFQHRPDSNDIQQLRQQAMSEFKQSIEILNQYGIETLILNKDHTNQTLPDAIFPNNWFSLALDGHLFLYLMKTQNRRDEVQAKQLIELLSSNGYSVQQTIDLREYLVASQVLEGTGSIIFHHPSQHLFAAISERCQPNAIAEYAERFNYQLVAFDTLSHTQQPIYHTNVLMSCGRDFAVICKEVIVKQQASNVINKLEDCVNEVLIISEQQMTEHFCGNILQLQDSKQQPVIALSQSAYNGFSSSQIKQLEQHGSLAICPIPTIERIGGGSIRCMLAENFISKN